MGNPIALIGTMVCAMLAAQVASMGLLLRVMFVLGRLESQTDDTRSRLQTLEVSLAAEAKHG